MRKGIFTIIVLSLSFTVLSCSDRESESAMVNNNTERIETVKELTQRLREYDKETSTCATYNTESIKRLPKPEFTTMDKAKIAMADVLGCIRGSAGGILGVVVGGVTQSLYKGIKIYLWKNFKAWIKGYFRNNLVIGVNGDATLEDSVGYYHNIAEYELYSKFGADSTISKERMIQACDSVMRAESAGYAAAGGLSSTMMSEIGSRIEAAMAIDDRNMDLEAYCNKLKECYPQDSDYIDFMAEFIFTAYYGNVDVAQYTEQVMFMVRNSNLNVGDSNLLCNCLRIAYASIIYNNNVEITEN